MTITMLAPAFIPPQQLAEAVKRQGYGVLNTEGLSCLTGIPLSDMNAIQADWNDLPPDNFLKDGGRYRRASGIVGSVLKFFCENYGILLTAR